MVASDITQSRSRGGTIAATGGTAAVGGSILADVYTKMLMPILIIQQLKTAET